MRRGFIGIGLEYENVAITSQMRDACREVLGI